MAPRLDEITTAKRVSSQSELLKGEKKQPNDDKLEIVWRNIALFMGLHAAALFGVFRIFHCKPETLIFCKISQRK
jgi:hypothetical protein